MGDMRKQALRVQFDGKLKLEFRGSRRRWRFRESRRGRLARYTGILIPVDPILHPRARPRLGQHDIFGYALARISDHLGGRRLVAATVSASSYLYEEIYHARYAQLEFSGRTKRLHTARARFHPQRDRTRRTRCHIPDIAPRRHGRASHSDTCDKWAGKHI